MSAELRAAIEATIRVMNEMHPYSGCASNPCTERTDFCIVRNFLTREYQKSQVQV